MKAMFLIFAAAVAISAISIGSASAAEPRPSQQCWRDGACLSDSLVPVPPAKESTETEHAAREGRPFWRPPVYYLPPPVVYTPSVPAPSICYVLNNGIYSPITCPPVAVLVPLPHARRR
jgi:hypothetical protein